MHPYLDGPYPRAFAHRGWHIGELAGMENSMRSFRRAALEGFCYLETDVHATADGVVVVLHDATLDRTTDGHGPIAAQRWAAVRTAKIDGKEPLCRLEDLLEDLPGVRINVDVKSDAAVPPVLEVLRRTGAWDRVCLASFSDQRLSRLRAGGGPRLITSLGRRAATALWLRSRLPLPPLPSLPSRVPPPRAPVARAPRRLAQLPHRQGRLTVVDPALVRHSHRLGTEVHVWTVDAAEEMVRLLDLGVDGLVTDRPDVLRTVLLARATGGLAAPPSALQSGHATPCHATARHGFQGLAQGTAHHGTAHHGTAHHGTAHHGTAHMARGARPPGVRRRG